MDRMDQIDKELLGFTAVSPGLVANDEPTKTRLDRLVELGFVQMKMPPGMCR
jgi:hypothetical protein